MNLQEEERLILERRKYLFEQAVEELRQAALKVEGFGYKVECILTEIRK